jgi:hypothetical protein
VLIYDEHRWPGQIQQRTPSCDEHVPDRFCEELYDPSLQTAVAPAGAPAGAGQVPPEGGVRLGLGLGLGEGVGAAIDCKPKSIRVSVARVRARSLVL